MTTTPAALLAACRKEPDSPDARRALADALHDEDGEVTPAVAVALAPRHMGCEVCDCPDTTKLVCWDVNGNWHWFADVLGYDEIQTGEMFGDRVREDEYDRLAPRCEPGELSLYHFTRWHLVCPHCKRSLAARKASATRKAASRAAFDAAPNLFTGVGDD